MVEMAGRQIHGRTPEQVPRRVSAATWSWPWTMMATTRHAVRMERDDRPPAGGDRPGLRPRQGCRRRRCGTAVSRGCGIAVRGGGHNVAGNGDGGTAGLVIDLGGLQGRRGRRRASRTRPRRAPVRRSQGAIDPRRPGRTSSPYPIGVISADRHRRSHARWRRRLADPQAWAGDRQPVGPRTSSRSTASDVHASEDRERRPVLGPAWRRRQLRDRHVVRVRPRADRADDHPRHPRLPGRARA